MCRGYAGGRKVARCWLDRLPSIDSISRKRQAAKSLTGRQEWEIIGAGFRTSEHATATAPLRSAARLPIDRERLCWRLDDKGLVRKEGPWVYALSAWAHPNEQGNPYQLERTQALSVYHQSTGLIVGGGNDKRAYHNTTIHILEGGDCHYFPAVRGKLRVGVRAKVLSGDGTCDRIEFDYGSARADLEVRVENTRLLRVGLGTWTSQTQPEIWLVLQLPLQTPIVLRNGRKELTLARPREGQPAAEYPLAKTIGSPNGWQMTLPAGTSLLWPHVPWNPYRPPTYLETPEYAVGLVRVPLHKHQWRAEVAVRVTSG